MKGIRPLYFLVVIVSCFSTFIQAQNWSGILDPARAIDWSQAGIPGGIPTNRTQCGSVVPAGASSSAIQAALNGTDGRGSCANKYVLLGAGTFSLSGSLTIPSNVTLRGSAFPVPVGSRLEVISWLQNSTTPLPPGTQLTMAERVLAAGAINGAEPAHAVKSWRLRV